MVAVRFLTSLSPYQPGEVAGFSEERARELVHNKVAEYYKAPSAPLADKMERGSGTKSLEDHNVSELKEMAADKGVSGYQDMRKAELIQTLSEG